MLGGWLWALADAVVSTAAEVGGWAATLGRALLWLVAQMPLIARVLFWLTLGGSLLATAAYLTRFVLDLRFVLRWRRQLWEAAVAYLARRRRWLSLFKLFVRNRKRIKYALLFSRVIEVIRAGYVFVEDVFFTSYWYFLILHDYACDLLTGFLEHFEDYFVEMDNFGLTHWYYLYIYWEQALYHLVGRLVLHVPRLHRRRPRRWAPSRGRRRRLVVYYVCVVMWIYTHRNKMGPRR